MSIKDIELRFVDKLVAAPEFGADVAKMVRVLEWRKLMERQLSETWVHEGREVPRSGVEQTWTDWTPVPYVADA
jgi:hypothetical protein